jgi:hypothetical protein
MKAGFWDAVCVHTIQNLNQLTHSDWTKYACGTTGGYLVILLISYAQ